MSKKEKKAKVESPVAAECEALMASIRDNLSKLEKLGVSASMLEAPKEEIEEALHDFKNQNYKKSDAERIYDEAKQAWPKMSEKDQVLTLMTLVNNVCVSCIFDLVSLKATSDRVHIAYDCMNTLTYYSFNHEYGSPDESDEFDLDLEEFASKKAEALITQANKAANKAGQQVLRTALCKILTELGIIYNNARVAKEAGYSKGVVKYIAKYLDI